MGFHEKILERLDVFRGKSFTLAQLGAKLNLRTHLEKKELQKAVKRLIRQGEIIDRGRGSLFKASKKNLIKGVLRGNKKGFAFLIREDKGPDMFIPSKSLNGAMHGDTVLSQLVGESEGVVISVVKQGIQSLVGTFIYSGNFGFVVPDDDSYYKDIFIPQDNANGAKPHDKVVVNIKIDTKTNKPFGVITDILGKKGERNSDVLSILRNYGFKEYFPDEVLEAAEKIRFKKTERKDFRELLTITIDGADAKDFDDAISIEKINEGFRLFVHVADVAHYVKPGSIIDKEAYERATSVYFPGSVFPMLPESISNGVCSLRPNEEKLTLTVEMEIDRKGNTISANFYESIIRSDYRMTYTDVTKILDGDKALRQDYAPIVTFLSDCKELAEIIEKKRKANGLINFITKESKIVLDDKGDVRDISPYPSEVSNSIIEHFMITANECVAEYISSKSLPCVYRIHETISEEKLENFHKFINGLGYSLNLAKGVSPKLFSDLLESIKDLPEEPIINKILLRSMQKAKYSTKNKGHFGLSLDYYCHFTSPIRRYPDLMVHRVLKAIISNKDNDKFINSFTNFSEEAAGHSSEREMASERAERDIDDYYKALFMTNHIGDRYFGIISGITGSGFFVSLDNTVEGFVPFSELPNDRYEIDEKNYRITGTKYAFSLCDKVEVEILRADIVSRRVDMSLVSDGLNHLKRKK